MSPRLILLASYPKSGNTWLRLVLANLARRGTGPVPINAIGLGRYSSRRLFDRYAPWPASDLDEEQIERWWPDVYRQFDADGDAPEFLKVHSGAWRNRDGEWLFPPESVRAVLHVTRHPFDIAMSFANHLGGTPERAVDIMTTPGWVVLSQRRGIRTNLPERYGSWAEHTASWGDPASPYPVVTCRYEDLLADPAAGFGRLAAAAGLVFTRDTLAQAIEWARFERLRDEEAREGFRERPRLSPRFFRAGRSGTWRGHLGAAARARLLAHCGNMMAGLGYGPSGALSAGTVPAGTSEGFDSWSRSV